MAAAVLLLSGALLLYVLVGYPALLAAIARRTARPVRKGAIRPSVSVLLPVRNGAKWLRAKLHSILQLNYPRELMEILVISDGSADQTDSIAQDLAHHGVKLIRIPAAGKAAALNEGMRQATGEILFFTDVRQRLDPEALRELVECFADPTVGVASGELVIADGETREEADTALYWRYEKWIRRRLSRIDSVLGATGCIYAMRRKLASPLPATTLLDDVQLPLGAFFRGYRVILEERAKAFDSPACLRTEFGRKVRTLAGVYQVVLRYPRLLGPSNRMWLHFLSHKLGRLLLPFALILIAASTFWLPSPWKGIAFGMQALFYALALLDPIVPQRSPVKRVTSPVRTFVVLMAAALCAVSILVVPAGWFWREPRKDPLETVS
jgi:cellulose synthase/poly-beta-1,6-N-acetylglucosamine synthase-like glycosyltransferase